MDACNKLIKDGYHKGFGTGHQLKQINKEGNETNGSQASAPKLKIEDSVKESVMIGNYNVRDTKGNIEM